MANLQLRDLTPDARRHVIRAFIEDDSRFTPQRTFDLGLVRALTVCDGDGDDGVRAAEAAADLLSEGKVKWTPALRARMVDAATDYLVGIWDQKREAEVMGSIVPLLGSGREPAR